MKKRQAGRGTLFRDDLKASLKNPAFRKAYADADVEFRMALAVIEAREKAGMTQRQLAEAIGTKQQTVSRIEQGAQNVTVGTLEKIAHALHRRLAIQLL